MNKQKLIAITFFIFTMFVISSSVLYAKYVLQKEVDVRISSAPFDFDAFFTDDRVVIPEDSAEFIIHIQNIFGNDERLKNTQYTVSVDYENDVDPRKFALEMQDTQRKETPTSWEDEVKFSISVVEGDRLSFPEQIMITVTSTSPYKREIKVPVDVYYTYGREFYNVDYVVEVYDENGVLQYTIPDEGDAYEDISLDSVFGTDRPTIVENGTFSFYVSIPGNYTADTYKRDLDGTDEKMTHGNYPLGTDPVYKEENEGLVADTDKGPVTLSFDDAFLDNKISKDQCITVKMTKKSGTPYFDVRSALGFNKMSGRGTTGDPSKGFRPTTDSLWPNIYPQGGWNWDNFTTNVQPMTKPEGSDKYSFTWLFQTNSGDSYMLDALELNGVNIHIPFSPGAVYKNAPEVEGPNSSTTTLPDGATATLEYLWVWNTNPPQRVYQLTIENALSNVVVTNANLVTGKGSAEIVVYNLAGVTNLYDMTEKNEKKQSDLLVGYAPDLVFQLLDHYEKPVVTYVYPSGETILIPTVIEEPEGTFTISGLQLPSKSKIGLLSIVASPIRYAIEYDLGDVTETDFTFASKYDDNNGAYYRVDNARLVSLSNEIPYDESRIRKFVNWTIEGGDGTAIKPGNVFTLDDVRTYARKDEETGIYILKVNAVWEYYES